VVPYEGRACCSSRPCGGTAPEYAVRHEGCRQHEASSSARPRSVVGRRDRELLASRPSVSGASLGTSTERHDLSGLVGGTLHCAALLCLTRFRGWNLGRRKRQPERVVCRAGPIATLRSTTSRSSMRTGRGEDLLSNDSRWRPRRLSVGIGTYKRTIVVPASTSATLRPQQQGRERSDRLGACDCEV
jgi:hypothetical protein